MLDATNTIGFFALTDIEFNLTAIAAFLTMVPMAIWGGAVVQSFAVPMV